MTLDREPHHLPGHEAQQSDRGRRDPHEPRRAAGRSDAAQEGVVSDPADRHDAHLDDVSGGQAVNRLGRHHSEVDPSGIYRLKVIGKGASISGPLGAGEGIRALVEISQTPSGVCAAVNLTTCTSSSSLDRCGL